MPIKAMQYPFPDAVPVETLVEGEYMEASEDSRMVAVFKDRSSAEEGPLAIFVANPGDKYERVKPDGE